MKRPDRKNYNTGDYGDIKYDKALEKYCSYVENRLSEALSELKKLRVCDVIRSCNHENKTNYCNTDGSYSHKVCDDCNETLWD